MIGAVFFMLFFYDEYITVMISTTYQTNYMISHAYLF